MTDNCPDNQVSWFQVNNWVPIIGSAVMIALSWGALNTKISLIDQKLDTYIANQNKIIEQLAIDTKTNTSDIITLKLNFNSLQNLKIGDK